MPVVKDWYSKTKLKYPQIKKSCLATEGKAAFFLFYNELLNNRYGQRMCYNQHILDQRKNLRVFFFKHTTSSVYIKRMPYLLPL